MVATEETVIYPVVVAKLNNIFCRAILDTCAGSSHASSALLGKLNICSIRRETKPIEMMMYSTIWKINVFQTGINEVSADFQFQAEVKKSCKRNTLITFQTQP